MQWLIPAVLLIAGIYLSAFFSGTETGFYRVSRIRLVLDARSGNRAAQRLLRLINRPAIFIGTTLVGNNVANYLTMLATVYVAHHVLADWEGGELLATLLLTPLVFVYGELMPKDLYFRAPGRLLRQRSGLLYFFTLLQLPLSLPLAAVSLILSRLAGQPTERVHTLLGRRRLEQLFHEGHAEGLLTPAQRQLVQGLITMAERPVTQWAEPISRAVAVRTNTPLRDVLRLTRRQRTALVPVRGEGPTGEWAGYVRASDLAVVGGILNEHLNRFAAISASESGFHALMQMFQQGAELALVLDPDGRPAGIVSKRSLCEGLFRSTA